MIEAVIIAPAHLACGRAGFYGGHPIWERLDFESGAEGATAPETLRQKDQIGTTVWRVTRSPRPPTG